MLHTTAPSRVALFNNRSSSSTRLAAARPSGPCASADRARTSSKHVCRTATPQSAVSPSNLVQWGGSAQSSSTPVALKPDPSPTAAKENKGYQWTKQWYPVAVEAALDPAVPHKVRP